MANDPTFAPDFETQQLQQKQAMAQALMQQGMQNNGGVQMVGPVAVGQSPVAGIANMLGAYLGGKMNRDATQQLGALNEQKRQKTAAILQQGMQALQNGNPQGAVQLLASDPSTAPYVQQVIKSQMTPKKGDDLGDIAKFTPESYQKYKQTGNYADLVLYQAPKEMSAYEKWKTEHPQTGKASDGYHPPIMTSTGVMKWDAKVGDYVPMIDPKTGKPYLPQGVDAGAQGAVADARAGGAKEGGARADARLNLAFAQRDMNEIDQSIAALENHPGLNGITGLRGAIPNVPGSDAADAEARREQLGGKAFLQARQALKGGGQITDYEGQKAEQAYVRMQKAQSVEAFKSALADYKTHVHKGFEILQKQANGDFSIDGQSPASNGRPPLSSFGGK